MTTTAGRKKRRSMARGAVEPGGARSVTGSSRGSVTASTQQPRHLARVDGVVHGILLADHPAVTEHLEGALHRDHPGPDAGLDDRLDLVRVVLADQVAYRRIDLEELDRKTEAATVAPQQELLGHHGVEHVGKLDPGLLLTVRGDDVDDALDALGGTLRV